MKKALIALYGLMVLLYASAYGFSLAALLVPVPFVGLALLTTEGVSRVVGRKAGKATIGRDMLLDKKEKKKEYNILEDPLLRDSLNPLDPSSGLYHIYNDD